MNDIDTPCNFKENLFVLQHVISLFIVDESMSLSGRTIRFILMRQY